MKRLSHLFFLFTMSCASTICFAQTGKYLASEYYSNYLPKGSSSATLGTFGNIPVNYYSGMPEISFELLRLKGREVEVPVSINYDASGVKTDDFSGEAGLKWTITAGGYVAREMNSLPDEHVVEGYWKYSKQTNYFEQLDYPLWVNWCEKNERDAEPDEFTINIPGRSIKFVFDKDKKIVTIPRQNVTVSHTMLGDKINGFELITEDGMRYVFGGTPASIASRHVASLNIRFKYDYKYAEAPGIVSDMYQIGSETLSHDVNYEEKQTDVYNARWYLTSIIAPSGETTKFVYQNTGSVSYVGRPAIVRVRPNVTTLDHFTYSVRRCLHTGIFGCDEYTDVMIGPFSRVAAVMKYPKTDPGSVCFSEAECGYPIGFFNPKEYGATPGHLNSYHTLITESDIRLLRIESATGNKIVFTTTPRVDLPGTSKIDDIRLYDHADVLVNSIKLNYHEIDANESKDYLWPGEALILFNVGTVTQSEKDFTGHHIRKYFSGTISNNRLIKYVYEGLKEYNYKRVFLSSVDQFSKLNGESIRLYKFDYRDANLLKRRTTPLHDRFGFSRTDTDYVHPWPFQSDKRAITAYSYSMDVYSNVADLRGMLSRITYPSGGYTNFIYESSGENPRLQVVQDVDENDTIASQKEIEYLQAAHNNSPVNHWVHDFNIWNTSDWMKYLVFSTAPVNNYALTHNVARGNKNVRVYYGTKLSNTGFEEFVFTSPVDVAYRDIEAPIYSDPVEQNSNGESLPSVTGIYPFPKSRNRDFIRGMPLSHKVFAEGRAMPLKETIYTYQVNPYGYVPQTVLGLKGGSFSYASHTNVSFWFGHEQEIEKRSRYSRFSYQPEWVVLKKTRSIIYDPSVADTTRNFDICTEYEYDPNHLQQIETITYHRDNPQEKHIARTRYVTHPDYNSSIAPSVDVNKAQALAIQHLRNKHQINTPVEVQSLITTASQTRLVKAVLYKYLKQGTGAGFAARNEIYDLNQAIELNSYTPSKTLADGTFTSDSRLRLAHTYNAYDPSTANIQKQTTRDGTVSTYQWGMNNSVVTGYVVNPGISQQQYLYDHFPLVGLKSTTDPNGRINRFEYDGFNRVRLTRDHDRNILSRYRYHYRGQNESLTNDVISISCALAGMNASLQSPENVPLGQTTYRWDFGDGTPEISTTALTVDHTWPRRGEYVVKVRKENPEYLSKEVIKLISFYNPIGAVKATVNGPTTYDICSLKPPTQPTTIQATINGDALSYVWEYKIGNGQWTLLKSGNGPVSKVSTSPPPQFGTPIVEGVFTVRLTVYDACGDQRSVETSLTNFLSTPQCMQY